MTIPGKSRTEITITRTHDRPHERYSFGPSLHLANDLITANQTEQRIQLDETPQPRNKIPHKTRSAATNETTYKPSQENQEPWKLTQLQTATDLPRKSRTQYESPKKIKNRTGVSTTRPTQALDRNRKRKRERERTERLTRPRT